MDVDFHSLQVCQTGFSWYRNIKLEILRKEENTRVSLSSFPVSIS